MIGVFCLLWLTICHIRGEEYHRQNSNSSKKIGFTLRIVLFLFLCENKLLIGPQRSSQKIRKPDGGKLLRREFPSRLVLYIYHVLCCIIPTAPILLLSARTEQNLYASVARSAPQTLHLPYNYQTLSKFNNKNTLSFKLNTCLFIRSA
jgi:hypothetical protein